jgi:hypothetical protein
VLSSEQRSAALQRAVMAFSTQSGVRTKLTPTQVKLAKRGRVQRSLQASLVRLWTAKLSSRIPNVPARNELVHSQGQAAGAQRGWSAFCKVCKTLEAHAVTLRRVGLLNASRTGRSAERATHMGLADVCPLQTCSTS